jgi:hypothetical protein
VRIDFLGLDGFVAQIGKGNYEEAISYFLEGNKIYRGDTQSFSIPSAPAIIGRERTKKP